VNFLAAAFILAGSFFAFVAALGLLRLPDILMRLHAATKAGAFGVSLMLIGAVLPFGTLRTAVIAVLIIVFFYVTAPVAAHLIGRAAYLRNCKLWSGTGIDELGPTRGKQTEPEDPGNRR